MNPFYAEAQFEEYVRDFLSSERYGIQLDIDQETGLFAATACDFETVRNTEYTSYGTTIATAMARAVQGLLSLERDSFEEIAARTDLSSLTRDEICAAVEGAFSDIATTSEDGTLRDVVASDGTSSLSWLDGLVPNADGSFTVRGE